MKIVDISPAEMKKRIAKRKDLEPYKRAFVDTCLPAHERDIYNVIGKGVNENPDTQPAIDAPEGFTITYVGAEPGKGAALHAHPTVEVFIPLDGKWIVYWGEDGEHEVELETGDCISVPVGVMRGFRNAGDRYATLIAIVGGSDSGKVAWPEKVLEEARASGLQLDEKGNLLEAS